MRTRSIVVAIVCLVCLVAVGCTDVQDAVQDGQEESGAPHVVDEDSSQQNQNDSNAEKTNPADSSKKDAEDVAVARTTWGYEIGPVERNSFVGCNWEEHNRLIVEHESRFRPSSYSLFNLDDCTCDELPVIPKIVYEKVYAVSPDNSKIAIYRGRDDGIAIIDLDMGSEELLALPDSNQLLFQMTWSPDGRYIVGVGGCGGCWVLDVEEREFYELTTGDEATTEYDEFRVYSILGWSSDSSKIAVRYICFEMGWFIEYTESFKCGLAEISIPDGARRVVVDEKAPMNWTSILWNEQNELVADAFPKVVVYDPVLGWTQEECLEALSHGCGAVTFRATMVNFTDDGTKMELNPVLNRLGIEFDQEDELRLYACMTADGRYYLLFGVVFDYSNGRSEIQNSLLMVVSTDTHEIVHEDMVRLPASINRWSMDLLGCLYWSEKNEVLLGSDDTSVAVLNLDGMETAKYDVQESPQFVGWFAGKVLYVAEHKVGLVDETGEHVFVETEGEFASKVEFSPDGRFAAIPLSDGDKVTLIILDATMTPALR